MGTPYMEGALAGKVALVTGASRGIGRAIAERFADAGAAVMLSSRNADALEAVTAKISSTGADVDWHVADAGDPDQATACVATTISRLGGLDILVNNAGSNIRVGRLIDLDHQQATDMHRVNQYAVISWTRAAWLAAFEARGGVVLNVAAIGGFAVAPGNGWYSATKAAVIHMTRQLAYEFGPGVRVNAIAPGLVDTDFARPFVWDRGRYVAERLPLRRLGVPDDIANAALFLASDMASWITGHTLVVDGGGLSTPPYAM